MQLMHVGIPLKNGWVYDAWDCQTCCVGAGVSYNPGTGEVIGALEMPKHGQVH